MRILQIEDDRATAHLVELMLKAEGLTVFTTDLGEEGFDLARHYEYDLILLDLGLPDVSGMDVLRGIRNAKVAAPVMVVTGDSRIETKTAAFRAGCDDYLVKPIHKDELVARIHAIIRRCAKLTTNVITVGELEVDIGRKVARGPKGPLHLTGKEWAILEILALRRGVTLTKGVLFDHVYCGVDEPEMKIVDVFVCKIRKKFAAAGLSGLIVTEWGRGYRLEAPVAVEAEAAAA